MIESALDDGLIVLGPRSPGCGGTAIVELSDAIVRIDPAEPGLLSAVTAFDRESAIDIADSLFWTEDLSRDASAVLLSETGQHPDVVTTPLMTSVLRAGLALWLENYSPDDLDQFWLDLEIGCRIAEAGDIVASAEDIMRDRLLGHVNHLLDLAERFRLSPDETSARLPALVLRGIYVVSTLMPESDERLVDLEHALELAMAIRRFGERHVDWDAALLTLLTPRTLIAAEHAGLDSPTVSGTLAGRSSVDWLQVPRGVLDTAEATVSWRLDEQTSTVGVDVIPGPRARLYAGVLAFRVLSPAGSLLGTGPLTLLPDGPSFRGLARITEADPKLFVDVFEPATAGRPRIGPAAVAAEAERAAARGITLARLVIGAGEPGRGRQALDLLQRANRLYAAAGDVGDAGWQADLAACQTQSIQVLHTLAAATEQEAVRSRADAALSRRGRSAHGRVFDAELSAAEIALLSDE